ncbi:MAG TPA: 30S ribosomal protein S7 [Candidatus Nanoarchaeia archaeon]|nr:30S ribosomal protein S7 [Candidatus Nanoarchaeia archaeon]
MEIKLFNRWATEGIKISDPGLERYISLEARIAPKTGARYAGNRFHKSKIFIVERLINKVMIPGHKSGKHFRSSAGITGKAQSASRIIENAFDIIEKKTKKNPVEVFVKALENAAQREEIITIEYGGARYPKAVECSPQRRIDLVLRHMTQGAFHKSAKSKQPIDEILAEEIMSAFNLSPSSNAIAKKLEVERQADASR